FMWRDFDRKKDVMFHRSAPEITSTYLSLSLLNRWPLHVLGASAARFAKTCLELPGNLDRDRSAPHCRASDPTALLRPSANLRFSTSAPIHRESSSLTMMQRQR